MNEPAAADRRFGLLDYAALWGALGATLYIMPFGSLLVPALSIERAVAATLVAALIAALLIAAVSALAARRGSSTLGLLTAVFGERVSVPLGLLLALRHVVWGAFALSLIAGSAELVSERSLGAGLRPLWVVLFGLAGLALVLAGPDFVVRKLLRRAGVWLVLLVALGVALSAYMEFEVPAYLKRPAVGGWPEFWQAVDVMLIVPLLWLPLVADFGRYARSVSVAARGSFLGLFAATAWFGVLGLLYLPAVERGDVAGFVAGTGLGLGALVLLLLLQTDEVFANAFSARTALGQAIPSRARLLSVFVGCVVIALALPFDWLRIEGSLLLIGSLFVPLFGVVLADELGGRFARRPAGAALPLAAWGSGFALYHWISPPDAEWWRQAVETLFADLLRLPFPLGDEATWLGAAIPSFVAAFLVQAAGARAVGFIRRPQPEPGPA